MCMFHELNDTQYNDISHSNAQPNYNKQKGTHQNDIEQNDSHQNVIEQNDSHQSLAELHSME